MQFHTWNVRVIRRAQRKSLTIEVKKNSPILVKANLTISKQKILHFLESKKSWIESHMKKMAEFPVQNFFEPNESGQILMLGGYHQLSAAELTKFDSKKYYTKRAKKYLPMRVKEIALIMGLGSAYSSVVVRSMRSRWGSCTAKGKITLNSKLLAAPEWIIESVIVHELSHLVHMNHSKKFWDLVREYSPRHKDADLWLKKYL